MSDTSRDTEKKLRAIADRVWALAVEVQNHGTEDNGYFVGEEMKGLSSKLHSLAADIGDGKLRIG